MQENNDNNLPLIYVSFVISAFNLDFEIIDHNLGIATSVKRRRGDYPQGNPRYAAFKNDVWSLQSSLPPEDAFERHLDNLLTQLEPNQSFIKSLAQDITIEFSCDLFGPNGFLLQPQLLARIASLGAALGVTVYPDVSESVDSGE